jgi:hypothetical protein
MSHILQGAGNGTIELEIELQGIIVPKTNALANYRCHHLHLALSDTAPQISGPIAAKPSGESL